MNREHDKARLMNSKKLEESGYVHPENPISALPSQYMAYSSGEQRSSSSSEPQTSYIPQNYNTYSTYSCEEYGGKFSDHTCPKCDLQATLNCNCTLKCMGCSNGHVWFLREGIPVAIENPAGDPHYRNFLNRDRSVARSVSRSLKDQPRFA